jgi:hypothetical protein
MAKALMVEHLMRMQLNYDIAGARARAGSVRVEAYRPSDR